MIHGSDVAQASRDIRFDNLLGRAVVVLSVFIPLFAFREIRRVMGEKQFNSLLFGAGGDEP